MISDAFVGEIRFFPYRHKSPDGWLPCNGQVLSIAQYQTLYSVIGTAFTNFSSPSTFAIPDLRGRAPIGAGAAQGAMPVARGDRLGTERVTLDPSELPAHAHSIGTRGISYTSHQSAFKSAPTATSWPGRYLDNTTGAIAVVNAYLVAPEFETETMDPRTLAETGGSQAHENRQPYLALAPYICVSGNYPFAEDAPPEI
ncbi:phage tail protein [Aquabacter cavernae]|uniref:phage tail protein n=1 Tax=Aquabacter cavernae TaxID=2496029 RepID=UPI000F8F2BC6|nr:tail fiber protein [Aquabacter cavernae]